MATNPQLVMRSGPNPGKTFSLTKPEMYIGRDISNDIVINDAEVSRKHVRLLLQGEAYLIEDLGSTNGTFINQQRIAGAHLLKDGETVQMGENVVLVYESASYDPEATAVMSQRDASMLDPEPEAPVESEPAFPPMPEPEPEPEPAPMPEPMDEPEPEPASPAMPEPMTPMSTPADTMAESAPPPPAMASPAPPAMPAPAPSETYTGDSMPEMPAAPMPEETPRKSSRSKILAGCGCLVILLCVVVAAGAWYIDSQNLWCAWLGLC